MIRYALPVLTLLALAGCSSLNMFVAGDLQNAAALATANGDAQGATCAGALAGAFQPTPAPAADGFFVKFERGKLAEGAIRSPACAPITAQVLINLSKATPILGNVIGVAGF